jgi:hypothetical protein
MSLKASLQTIFFPPSTSKINNNAGTGHPRPCGDCAGSHRARPAVPRVRRDGGRGAARGAVPRDALDAAGEGGGVPVAGGLGVELAACAAQAHRGLLAADGLPAGVVVRDVRARGPRPARARHGAARRVLRRARRGHGHGGSAAHVPGHDETRASTCPWAVWTRTWTAEENRHGDILGKYMYLSGRVGMRMVEKTVQYLIGSGMVRIFRSWVTFHCFS